ncbi:androglobin [Orussus abietinus]|uniref:androglobin n=1 Tax=Orussus abietinus TaxID=222816 RepID=UPI000C71617E|nr:androglobin [Orussus abietinus]
MFFIGPDDGFFWDTETVMMPPSLSVHKWIRARELANLSAPPTVFVPGGEQFDFSRNNGHILHSEFARWFISSVVDLQYCGRSGLEVASEGNFLWNNANQPWQGWFNVYSLNKAGKGAAHRPSFNTHGKYIVRLFFMGCWRRFLVDDRIPVDEEGKPLLPCTANNFELWPMLLAKALLKIASLSWTPIREITDFSVITCLTGWLCLSLDVTHLSTRSKWDFLRKYADRFEWSSQTMDFDGRFLNSDGESRRKQIKESHEPSTVLFIVVSEMTNLSSGNVPSTAPCSGYLIYVELLRDVPLDPGEVSYRRKSDAVEG